MNHADARLDDAIRAAVRTVVATSPEPPPLPDARIPHVIRAERPHARWTHWRSALAAAAVIALVTALVVTVVDRRGPTTARPEVAWTTVPSPTSAAATRLSTPQLLGLGGDRAILLTVDVIANKGYVVRASTYSADANRWIATPDSPVVAQVPGLASWTGRVVVMLGGVVDPSGTTARPLLYDPAHRHWSFGTAAPVNASAQRNGLYPAVWDGIEVVMPGQGLAYDPVHDRWRELAPSPLSPLQYGVAVWTGHEVLLWGACDLGGACAAADANPAHRPDTAAYDPARNRWQILPHSPLMARSGVKGVFAGGRLFVWGGYVAGADGYGATFDPATDQWRAIPDAPITRRARFAITALGNGVVIWGGRNASGQVSALRADGATYDVRTGRWETLPPAPLSAREYPSALTIGDSVLVGGGDAVEAPNVPTPPPLLHDAARVTFSPR
ncbi:MAG TPA: kelch repeat-containing protein [Acidimicrobiia bacterium]